jgi:YgiT-type zinc finger domain-containing protein
MRESQGQFVESAQAMYERMQEWRQAHPQASFDEIAAEVGRERRALMGQLLVELACQNQRSVEALSTTCPICGGQTEGKGAKERGVSHLEGETKLVRGYRYCSHCGRGFFPPGCGTEAQSKELES